MKIPFTYCEKPPLSLEVVNSSQMVDVVGNALTASYGWMLSTYFQVVCTGKTDAVVDDLTASCGWTLSRVCFFLHRSSLSECACIICYGPAAPTSRPDPVRLEKVMLTKPDCLLRAADLSPRAFMQGGGRRNYICTFSGCGCFVLFLLGWW